MKAWLFGILIASLAGLVYILFTRRLGFAWLTKLGLRIALAAIAIYITNFSGLFTEVYIPVNPITISSVLLLGMPGVAMLIGIKLTFI